MVSPPSRKQLSHERIVEVAARAIRRTGFQGIGVADLMREAGLTHGGFYAHFNSRDALLCEALERAGRDSAANMAERAARVRAPGISALRKFVDGYLSETHLHSAEGGCPVAALACEMPRQSAEVRAAAAQRVRDLVNAVRQALPPKAPADLAVVIASQLAGAVQLARALDDTAQAKALLAATRRSLLAQHDKP